MKVSRVNDGMSKDYRDEKVVKSQRTHNSDDFSSKLQEELEKKEKDKSPLQLFHEKMEQMSEAVRNGETEPTFQIGSESYTIKEWDKLLESFDDAEEEIREQIQEEIEQKLEAEEITTKNQIITYETEQVN